MTTRRAHEDRQRRRADGEGPAFRGTVEFGVRGAMIDELRRALSCAYVALLDGRGSVGRGSALTAGRGA